MGLAVGGSRGSVTLELAVVVPVLIMAAWGGAALAHGAVARAALQLMVMRAARELAAGASPGSMPDTGRLYPYAGFASSYGLPRHRIRMLAGRQGGLVAAAACYRLAGAAARAAGTLARAAGETTGALAPEGPMTGDGRQLDQAVRLQCGGGMVVTARAAFAAEPTVRPPLQVVHFGPSPVDVGNSFPGRLPRAGIVVRAAGPTRCAIRVQYRSGPSQARGLQPPARDTDAAGEVGWAWNVGSSTAAGLWPVRVACANGQQVTRYLEVVNDGPAR